MKARRVVGSMLTMFLISLGVFGCALAPIDLVREGTVDVEYVSSRKVRLSNVSVHVKQPGLLISGEIKKRYRQRAFTSGHVHIEVISPQDEILGKATTQYRFRSTRSTFSHFSAEIPVIAPVGTTIRVIHHDTPTSNIYDLVRKIFHTGVTS